MGGTVALLAELFEAVSFGVQLGLSCKAVRMQFFELLRRDAPRPASRIGVAANVLDGAAARQAIFVTMESAPRPNPGLWMRIDIFGREGYRQTFYPFWRDAEVFHDFLASCAEIAEAPRPAQIAQDQSADPADGPLQDGDILPPTVTVEPDFSPANPEADSDPKSRPRISDRATFWRGILAWFSRRLHPDSAQPGRPSRAERSAPGRDKSKPTSERSRGHWNPDERMEPETLAIQTTSRRGEADKSHCSLMSFLDLSAVLDHVLLSGNRVAIKVVSDGPDLWAVIWRRPDGGLYLRWGGLEHPAGPIYRESPRTLFKKLTGYDFDLERVWSQSRPAGG